MKVNILIVESPRRKKRTTAARRGKNIRVLSRGKPVLSMVGYSGKR
jgi:hypothetical protein